jgi:DNA polymerase bacteriophage-type
MQTTADKANANTFKRAAALDDARRASAKTAGYDTLKRRASEGDRHAARALSQQAIERAIRKERSRRKHAPRATIDFETRSVLDVTKVGAWIYSRHASTEVLCLAYKLPGWKRPKLWHMAHPDIGIEASPLPKELFQWIRRGGLVEAHNAEFEMCIWQNVCLAMGWPAIAPAQWRCSAAKASAVALPRALNDLCVALGLPPDLQKDKRGKDLLRKYSRPKKLTKDEKLLWGVDAVIFNEDAEGLAELWAYCIQDVVAEEACSEDTPDLPPDELRLWQITVAMNMRGVMIDVELCEAALKLAGKAKAKANEELEALTGDVGSLYDGEEESIGSGTQRAALKAWLEKHEGFTLEDTKGKTLEWYIERKRDLDGHPISAKAIRILEIIKEVNRTSTNKYKRMLQCVDTDDRIRGNLVYCGAERTGRFSGKGVQLHNLPKGRFTAPKPKKPGADATPEQWAEYKRRMASVMDDAVAAVKSGDLAWCEAFYGDVMNLIASCLRGVVIAPPGKDLMIADYASIEARCILWLAGAMTALEVFKGGGDIYCDMASGIYGHEVTKDNARVISSSGATERDFGKVAILGLGYGMGWVKFLITLRTYNIRLTRAEVLNAVGAKVLAKYTEKARKALWPNEFDFSDDKKWKSAKRAAAKIHRALRDEREKAEDVLHELALCKYVVDVYRSRYPEVPAFWKAQNNAAISAIRNKGQVIEAGRVSWQFKGRYLRCRLPSGRCLHYFKPEVVMAKNEWGNTSPSIRFIGRNLIGRFERQATYGGKLAENITQATARDILGHAKRTLSAEWFWMDLLVSVHDEIIGEVDESPLDDREGVKEFEAALADLPDSYEGCPIAAEGRRLKRYRK